MAKFNDVIGLLDGEKARGKRTGGDHGGFRRMRELSSFKDVRKGKCDCFYSLAYVNKARDSLFVFKLAVIFLNAVVFNATVLTCGPYAISVPFWRPTFEPT
ncbi:hypothetical protein Bca4012_050540 [Brassica carinata]